MKNQLTSLYLVLGDFVEPLRRSVSSPEALEHLFHRYGWVAPTDLPVFERIRDTLSVVAAIEDFLATAETLQQTLDENPDADLDAGDIAALLEVADPLIRALAEFELPDLTDLAEPFGRPDFWESIADHLLDDLMEEYLRICRPGIFLVLRLWGALRYEPTRPTEPFRRPYTRISLDWDRVLDMTREPLASLKQAYHWDDPARAFDHQAALDALAMVLRAMRLPAARVTPAVETSQRFAPDPGRHIQQDVSALRTILLQGASFLDQSQYKLGFEVFPAARADQPDPSGLMIKPVLQGSAAQEIPLGDRLSLHWSIAADQGDRIGFALFPGVAELIGGAPAVATRLEIASTNGDPWYLVGNARTSRIELSGFAASIALEGSVADPEVKLRVAAGAEAGDAGGKVVILLEDADPFVSQAVERSSLEFSFSPEVLWSSKTGLTFNGNTDLEVNIPAHIDLGPVTLTGASIAVIEGPPANGVASSALRVGVGIQGAFGPVAFVVEKLGFTLSVARHTRRDITAAAPGADLPVLGGLDVDLSFAPPRGIGLSVDTEIIKGGGYLYFDPDRDEYAGALELTIKARVTVQAIAILTTDVPGPAGYALFISLSARFSISITSGFFWTGVGGMLGHNHGVAIEHLQQGLRTRALDDVLFPDDLVANAPRILATLRTVFPLQPGSDLLGLVLELTWGAARLVKLRLGLLIQYADNGNRITLLGQFKITAPDEKTAIARINVDFIGDAFWDDNGHRIAFDAQLYDSQLDEFSLTGSASARSVQRVSEGGDEQSDWLVSIGGFHPRYEVSRLITETAPVPRQDRVGFEAKKGIARMSFEAYLAFSANSIQFGARVDLVAKRSGFSAEAALGLDVIFITEPCFQFVADIEARAAIKRGSTTLMSVDLRLGLSGPRPWHARGKVEFSIFFVSFSIGFDEEWGDPCLEELPLVELEQILAAELAADYNWGGLLSLNGHEVASFRDRSEQETGVSHPLGSLEFRQRRLPLALELEKVGRGLPAAARRLDITAARIVGPDAARDATLHPVHDEFAPGQFFDLTEEEKLTRPSFERFASGAVVTPSGGVTAPAGVSRRVEYETIELFPEGRRRLGPYIMEFLALVRAVRFANVASGPSSTDGPVRPLPSGVTVRGSELYVVASIDRLERADAGEPVSYEAARQRARPLGANVQVVELHEALT